MEAYLGPRKDGIALYIRKFTIPEGSSGREKHRLEHQAGLSLLKIGLHRQFGLEIEDLTSQIQAKEKGKPYLPAYPHIHFNISHSGDIAVCALGSSPLGVDVEKLRPVKLHSTKRMLSARERIYLEGLPEGQRTEALFRFWTLKESRAKALGVGLGMDFTKAEFSLRRLSQRSIPVTLESTGQADRSAYVWDVGKLVEGERWRYTQLLWEQSYVIAVCVAEELQYIYLTQ